MLSNVLMAHSTQATQPMLKSVSKHIIAAKGAKYTRSRLPVKLIYQKSFDSKEAAMSAESYFKQKTRQQKLAYIEEHTSIF